jgi:hypothetical protein
MARHGAYLDPTFISLVQRIESAAETGLPRNIVDNLMKSTRADRARVVVAGDAAN